jgi:hypothetical protein
MRDLSRSASTIPNPEMASEHSPGLNSLNESLSAFTRGVQGLAGLRVMSKKTIHHGEEALMLAVLKSATEDFQKYVNARDRKGKLLFNEAEEWLLENDSDSLLCFESICEVSKLQPDIYVKDCSGGKRRIVSPRPRRSSHYRASGVGSLHVVI